MTDDLYSGLEKIADSSYRFFLESFGLDEEAFGEATRFETYITVLFYIDYCIAGESISEGVRENFYKSAKAKIIERFSNSLSNTDLSDIIDHRYYDEYSQIPMKRGKDWLQSFHKLYEIKLKGTENTNIIKKFPEIKAEGIFEWVPKGALFARYETANIYGATKLVKELFAGKKLHTIMQEIKEANSKIKQEFREKRS